ncbi:Outer membrane receptor for ferrienterochelin and colicins [Spirosomataceae bacterium TFI 002]|nr:Outer membrane receptor for ferrienterochelin and colicins [Spirosomataceae bacterium TFI 002]
MKKLIALLFLSTSIFAQTAIVQGLIMDESTLETLEYASVTIKSQKDSLVFKGQITDAKGNFKFINLEKGQYFLKITNIGYSDKSLTIDLKESSEFFSLGSIMISPSEELLQAIQVTGQKPHMLTQLEKQVFAAKQFENAKGASAIEVLRNLPSVSINAEGELTIRGAKGFLLLINGTPTVVDPITILSQLAANDIENIEVITAPSARYDADGKAGIINIVTKKGVANASSLSVNLQVGLPRIQEYFNAEEPQRYGMDIGYAMKQNKWEVSLSGNFQKNDIAGRRVGDVNTTIDEILTEFPSQGERSFKKYNYGFRGLASYEINKRNSLSIGAYHGRRNQYRLADIYYNNSKTDLRTNQIIGQIDYFNSNLVRKTGDFSLANVDYNLKVNETSNLTVSGLFESAKFSGFTKNRNLNIADFSDTLAYTLNTNLSPLNAYRLKADYSKKLGKGNLNVGYQYRFQDQIGNYLYQEQNVETKEMLTNEDFSADVDIINRIHALYAEYGYKKEGMSFNVGLRYENSFRSFEVVNEGKNDKLVLNNLFPSFNFLKDLPNDFKLKAGLSRRVQRSTNNELNPFPEREHSETLEQGDPLILPEFITLSEVGLIKDFEKGSSYLTVYRQDIENIVNRVNSVYNDTILNRIFTNAGKAVLMGAEVGFNIKPIKWWTSYVGANVYQLQIKGDLFNNAVNVNTQGLVYSINTNQDFKLKKDFGVQFNLNYLSKRVTAQGEDSRFFLPNLSVNKGFNQNKIVVSLQWQNIVIGSMATNEQRITTSGTNFFTTTNYIQETNIIRFNLSYKLNQSLKTKNLPNSEFGEREF